MLINESIQGKTLRVVGSDGSQLGVMPRGEALDKAAEQELDLVLIAPNAEVPVCRIMDYGKYKFEQSKREKEARKKQKIVELKEIRLSLNIDTHDIEIKAKNARKFLSHGDKVKVSIRFKGRQMAHQQLGYGVMNSFIESLADISSVDRRPKIEGRSMISFLTPKPVK